MANPGDESPTKEAATVLLRVYINKQYELTKNFDITQDEWKLAELDKDEIDIDSLREDIPQAFRKAKWIKPLFKNEDEWEWKIYSYDTKTASVEIEDDDDLQTEIDEFMPSDPESGDEDDDLNNTNKYLKLRVVFFRSMGFFIYNT